MKLRGARPAVPMSLARARSHTMGLVMPRFEDMFSSFYALEILKGVGKSSSRLKLDVLIHVIDPTHDRLFANRPYPVTWLDGILFADLDVGKSLLDRVRKEKVPYIVMNNYFEEEPISCVGIDNRGGAVQAVGCLIRLGHRRIATIAGSLHTQAGRERLEGYRQALESEGVQVDEAAIGVGDFTRRGAREAMQKFLRAKSRPTAVFCASDLMALEAAQVAREEGLQIPRDVSIIGFDDSPLAAAAQVPLTSVHQPLFEMGRVSCELLNEIIVRKKKHPVKQLLPTRLVERSSTGAPPG